jgi:sugar lactone lactonase YvrE
MLQTFPYGVTLSHSNDIEFRNLHMDSNSKVSFDNAIVNRDTGAAVRFREFATMTMDTSLPPRDTENSSTTVHRVASGFYNIAGAAVAPDGDLYFVDTHEQKVYRWNPGRDGTNGSLTTICDAPLDIANIAIDPNGDLMLVSYTGNGTVYSLKAGAPLGSLTLISPQPAKPLDGVAAVHANDYWALREKLAHPETSQDRFQFVSPDGRMFLSADQDFIDGALFYGTKVADVLRTFGLQPAVTGKPFYVSDEEEQKTYAGGLDASGNLTALKLFAERGGEGVTSDSSGNVYIAAGEVFVYRPDGGEAGVIRVPERPIDLVVAQKARKQILYILARTSLYEVDLASK